MTFPRPEELVRVVQESRIEKRRGGERGGRVSGERKSSVKTRKKPE